MKKTIAVETNDIVKVTETGRLIESTPRKTSEFKIKTSSSASVTSEEVARQSKAGSVAGCHL